MNEAEVERLFRKLDRIEDGLLRQAETNGINKAEHIDLTKTLGRIEQQVTKTNGRVTSLEGKWLKVSGAVIVSVPIFSLVFKVLL